MAFFETVQSGGTSALIPDGKYLIMSRFTDSSENNIVNNAISNPSSKENWIIVNVEKYNTVVFNDTDYTSSMKGHNKSSGSWVDVTVASSINISSYDGLWWYWGQSMGQIATFS